jgi:carbonic anhydrase
MKKIMNRARNLKKQMFYTFTNSNKLSPEFLKENLTKFTSKSSGQETLKLKLPTMNSSSNFNSLITKSKIFQTEQLSKNQKFFEEISQNNTSKILWIGCSDSRVDPSEILNSPVGNLTIQRNIANQVNLNDSNILSVIEQAIEYQKVNKIVVCGHTNCGGINASCGDISGLNKDLKQFIEPIHHLFHRIKDDDLGLELNINEKMYKENVKFQVENLKKFEIVRKALESKGVEIVPLIYKMEEGVFEAVE